VVPADGPDAAGRAPAASWATSCCFPTSRRTEPAPAGSAQLPSADGDPGQAERRGRRVRIGRLRLHWRTFETFLAPVSAERLEEAGISIPSPNLCKTALPDAARCG
jgi:hypothetical protein